MEQIPPHLKKYIVEQNYDKYTSIDHACWRYILRQLRAFLGQHAHECYLEGLKKTGIDIERIPRIEEISRRLEQFGWRALPVSGFIPPAAFMELQSLSVLPIASDMRSIEHLSYTPAPDIVHEAAGHAPILIHPEFADYLKQYAQVAKKALISKEDLDLYEAIRDLSDLKENPTSTPEQIEFAEKKLARVSKSLSHVSEAAELGRMNWWTAEYGLIGDLKSPKIFGAGLLSSVGESKWCLSDKVKKVPLTVDCIHQTYDITEPQPQLFVTPDFKTLSRVLDDMANRMAFRTGGLSGLQKAIAAQTVNTAQLDSGIQISGLITEALEGPAGQVGYVKTQGPTQLAFDDHELEGHSIKYHAEGFGTPVGYLTVSPHRPLSEMTLAELNELNIAEGRPAKLEFISGVVVEGNLVRILRHENKNIVMTFAECQVRWGERILFDPAWGAYDMAVGGSVNSVFGGPADRLAFGGVEDFVAKKIPLPQWSDQQKKLQGIYSDIWKVRQTKYDESRLKNIYSELESFPEDWLSRLEIFELAYKFANQSEFASVLERDLRHLALEKPVIASVISDGLELARQAI